MKRSAVIRARASVVALACALMCMLIAGCAAPEPPHRYFVLEADAAAAARAAAPAPQRDGVLLVAPVGAAGFYRSRDIVFSRAPGTRGYYQYSGWTEPPAIAISGLLMSRLERAGGFRTVVPAGAGTDGTLLLRVHLDELLHDATTPPGSGHVALTAQLVDPRTRAVVDKRVFSADAPAASYDADGAVAALRRALDQALDQLVSWVMAAR